MNVGGFLGFLVYVTNMLFNNTRLFDKNQQLSTASVTAFIFFKYVENDTSVLSYLESGLPVHISWNREVSRKQQMMQDQKHRAWHFMMGI